MGGGATRAFRKRSFVGDLSWVAVQQKAFTKWANVRLKKAEREEHAIDDIYTELKDGIKLVELCVASFDIFQVSIYMIVFTRKVPRKNLGVGIGAYVAPMSATNII